MDGKLRPLALSRTLFVSPLFPFPSRALAIPPSSYDLIPAPINGGQGILIFSSASALIGHCK